MPDASARETKKQAPHPMQPVVFAAHGVLRFKANAIVRALLDTGKLTMNDLACMDFSDEDRMQFAQLIGYSVRGYGELSYVSDASYAKAEKRAEAARRATPLPAPEATSDA